SVLGKANAQVTSEKKLKSAIKLISLEDYNKAKIALEEVLSKDAENASALYYYGIAQLNLQENTAGKSSIEKALKINPNVDPTNSAYWQGKAYFQNLETKMAEEKLIQYKTTLSEKSPEIKEVDNLLSAIESIEKLKSNKPKFYVESLPGELNTSYADHSPLITSDGSKLIFTSKNQEGTDRKEKKNGEFFENIYTVKLNNLVPTSSPQNLSASINTDRHDASIQLYDNDTKMLLYRINKGGNIYSAKKENGNWTEPKDLGKSINSSDYESHAFMLADGKTLFFSSNRKSKNGTLNIFKTILGKDGNWQEPELLGPEINSEDADEDCPFVTNDGKTIYFSSKGHNSIGGYDIFVSNWNEQENKWSEAENLGIPVNSVGDDMYFVLDKSSTKGFFSSYRENGKGGMDIYYVGKVLPVFLNGEITVENISDTQFGEVKVALKNVTYGDEYQSIADNNGKFKTSLDANTEYQVFLYSKDYKNGTEPFSKQTITVPKADVAEETITKSITIPTKDYHKLEKDYQLKGALTTTEGLKIDGKIEVIDSKSGKLIVSANTTDGNFKSSLKSVYGKEFYINVKSNGQNFEKVASFATKKEKEVNKDLVISFSETVAKSADMGAAKAQMGYTSNHAVLFSTNSARLNKNSEKELDRIFSSIKQEAGVEVLIEGYADNVGRAAYNLKLSKKRAKEVAKYLNTKGINKKKMTVKFFGEENPTASNDTDSGRAKNRRVEIHIK
ncbi:MAG: OmpA family protein, partial [Bacteroidota bacterium]